MSDLNRAYSEISEIFKLLDDEYLNKVSPKFRDYVEDKKDKNYIPNIRPDIPLEEQNLLQDTINILVMVKLDYWCEDENEKRELLELLDENERNYQKELYQKYNPDNLLKKENTYENTEKSLVIVDKEKWYKKIFDILKGIFRKN